MHRNLSPQRMFERLAEDHEPVYRFSAGTQPEFSKWKTDARARVLETLGTFPDPVPADPTLIVEWEHDSLKKQKWLINVGKYISATLQINYPSDLKADETRPAIQCWHGHITGGKEPIMGNPTPKYRAAEQTGSNFGHVMAKAGFITYGIDWIGRGDRCEAAKPHHRSAPGGRDWCNLYYLHATMLGTTSIAINVQHGKAATDFVCSLPNVDPDRLGVMGKSGGGTMTLWSAFCDPRVKAAEIICYSGLWKDFGFNDINYCGMQIAPGLFRLVDLPDLQGLLAPMPLLVDIGIHDTCFRVESSLECFRQVENIYKVAGAPEHLELDLFPGEHSWAGNKSVDFFQRRLTN